METLFKIVNGERIAMTAGEASAFLASQPGTNLNPVPQSVTPRQARRALLTWGITAAQVTAFIDAIEDEQEKATAQIDWEYATEIRRDNPLIAAFAAYLEKTTEEVDDFFRDAAGI
jgi:hypothetical protein